ncbi:MAG: hypothetical protein KBT87_07620 [Gammaproteobacteria bacterium]|nr:hypothetical protein [Gammaproteobacteria bacterium]MBQ0774520.1 hypothetical protein [Gammaproteobacteria bacterium]|tara:strand:- start:27689 stop:28300 length:612 start_codon:yes stop_codon:yes gene_type:complete
MAIEFYLMMPLTKDQMDVRKTKELINFLVDHQYIDLEMDVKVWENDGEYYEEDDCYDDLEHKFDTLGGFAKSIDNLNIEKINFEVGLSHYRNDLNELEKEGKLPGINVVTSQLKDYMDDFCKKNDIPPVIDVFGGITFGLVNSDSEDGQNEIRGVGVYCDGNVAQFMEDSGFLKNFDRDTKLYKLFEQVAAIFGADVVLEFRY